MSVYPDNWVSAIIGDHYKSLGEVGSLADGKETPFDDIYSRYYSYSYIKEMKDAGVWRTPEILKHPIIVIEDYYKVEPIDVDPHFKAIGNGVYVYEDTEQPYKYLRIDVAGSTIENNAPWYTRNLIVQDKNYTMVESFPTNDTVNKLFKFRIYLDSPGCSELSLRYLDGSNMLGFRLLADKQVLGTQYYENTGKIKERIFTLCGSEKWILISVEPISKPLTSTTNLYMSLVNTITLKKVTPETQGMN
jgi:hypothetical protein